MTSTRFPSRRQVGHTDGAVACLARLALPLAVVLGLSAAPGPVQATTFVVDDIRDNIAQKPNNNNVCDAQGMQTCTLRAAIEEAINSPGGPHTITFNILPAGQDDQPRLDPDNLGTHDHQRHHPDGLRGRDRAQPCRPAGGIDPGIIIESNGGGTTIRGLVINRCPGNAIRIFGSSNNTIAGNYIGTDYLGTTCNAFGNLVGIRIEGTATPSNGNLIGGGTAADRNIISGSHSSTDGIQMQGQAGGNFEQHDPGQLHRHGRERHRDLVW